MNANVLLIAFALTSSVLIHSAHSEFAMNSWPGEAATPSADTGGSIQMNRIALLPASRTVLTSSVGFDVDQDGSRELILRRVNGGSSWGGVLEFFECSGDNSFEPVHALDLQAGVEVLVSCFPGDIGDGDQDGRSDMTVYGRAGNDFYVRAYEGPTRGAYPSVLSWESGGNTIEAPLEIPWR